MSPTCTAATWLTSSRSWNWLVKLTELLYRQGIAVRQDQGGGRPQIFETLINGVTGELHMDGEGGQDRLDKDTVLLVGGRQRLGGSRRLESHQGRMVCHSGVHAVHP